MKEIVKDKKGNLEPSKAKNTALRLVGAAGVLFGLGTAAGCANAKSEINIYGDGYGQRPAIETHDRRGEDAYTLNELGLKRVTPSESTICVPPLETPKCVETSNEGQDISINQFESKVMPRGTVMSIDGSVNGQGLFDDSNRTGSLIIFADGGATLYADYAGSGKTNLLNREAIDEAVRQQVSGTFASVPNYDSIDIFVYRNEQIINAGSIGRDGRSNYDNLRFWPNDQITTPEYNDPRYQPNYPTIETPNNNGQENFPSIEMNRGGQYSLENNSISIVVGDTIITDRYGNKLVERDNIDSTGQIVIVRRNDTIVQAPDGGTIIKLPNYGNIKDNAVRRAVNKEWHAMMESGRTPMVYTIDGGSVMLKGYSNGVPNRYYPITDPDPNPYWWY